MAIQAKSSLSAMEAVDNWNCWGLRNLYEEKAISHLVRGKSIKVLFLMETKQSVHEMKKLQENLRYQSVLAVPSIRRSGGLAML